MDGVRVVTSIEGFGEGFNESAAKLPWVWFCYNGVEPARGWLYALQKLVRTMRTGARTVTVAFPHRSLNDALSNGWLLPIGEIPVDTLIMLVMQLSGEECCALSPRGAVLAEVSSGPGRVKHYFHSLERIKFPYSARLWVFNRCGYSQSRATLEDRNRETSENVPTSHLFCVMWGQVRQAIRIVV